jgi:tyrosyl-tRNA synthetase
MSKTFIQEFCDRGFLHQCTNFEKLKEITESQKIAAYIGFDITAKSLHVGNLMQVMILRMLQKHGHKPIIIVGGATTKIGDPTGKDEMRKILTDDDINENIKGIKKSLEKFFEFGDGPSDAMIVNNDSWLSEMKYIDFLREYGRHFSINRMLTMDSVKLRLEREQNLTFLEFNYMLLQGYDFLELNRKYNCILQIGGSDQWGNIIQGVELARRADNKEIFGLTTPLITTSSGVKMGKSLNGAVWINEDMLSPYDYYQFFRNTEDADVIRFAKFYTEMSDEEFGQFTKIAETNINEAKKILAFQVTKICHGEASAINAAETARKVFEEGGRDGLPEFDYDLSQPVAAYELFFAAGFVESKSEARKLIRGGGARINDEVVSDENMEINQSYIKDGSVKLSAGKKRHMLLNPGL